jgi:hypothetical protein
VARSCQQLASVRVVLKAESISRNLDRQPEQADALPSQASISTSLSSSSTSEVATKNSMHYLPCSERPIILFASFLNLLLIGVVISPFAHHGR